MIKDGYQSGRKVVPYDSQSDFPLTALQALGQSNWQELFTETIEKTSNAMQCNCVCMYMY